MHLIPKHPNCECTVCIAVACSRLRTHDSSGPHPIGKWARTATGSMRLGSCEIERSFKVWLSFKIESASIDFSVRPTERINESAQCGPIERPTSGSLYWLLEDQAPPYIRLQGIAGDCQIDEDRRPVNDHAEMDEMILLKWFHRNPNRSIWIVKRLTFRLLHGETAFSLSRLQAECSFFAISKSFLVTFEFFSNHFHIFSMSPDCLSPKPVSKWSLNGRLFGSKRSHLSGAINHLKTFRQILVDDQSRWTRSVAPTRCVQRGYWARGKWSNHKEFHPVSR